MGITKVFLKRIVGPKISRAKPRPPLCLPWPHPASTATATLVLEGDVEDGRKMMLVFYIVCFICIFFRIYLQFLLIFIFVSLSFLYLFPLPFHTSSSPFFRENQTASPTGHNFPFSSPKRERKNRADAIVFRSQFPGLLRDGSPSVARNGRVS